MKTIVIDTETTVKCEVPHFSKAAPWYYGNEICFLGYTDNLDTPVVPTVTVVSYPTFVHTIVEILQLNEDGERKYDLIVGHNIAFDLHYFNKYAASLLDTWLRSGGKIWDTMIAEYLLSNQTKKFPSLDTCCKARGLPIKDDKIKEYWKNGIQTEDIDPDELIPYLVNDVQVTAQIFKSQVIELERNGMLKLAMVNMEARLATWEMERNGATINVPSFAEEETQIRKELNKATDDLFLILSNRLSVEHDFPIDDINMNSAPQWSLFFFGGTTEVKKDLPILDEDGNETRYKSGMKKGQVKTKKQPVKIDIPPLINPAYFSEVFPVPTQKAGVYKVDESTLHTLAAIFYKTGNETNQRIVERLLYFRNLGKSLKTFFEGIYERSWAFSTHLRVIHTQYNHCVTPTGRLSSSNPNLQNISNKETDLGDSAE